MRIAVIGSGGREHALVWRLQQDGHAVTCLPGRDGIPNSQPCADDNAAILARCRALQADLVVIGPEAPLQRGLGDELRSAGLAVLGPNRDGAQLEASKAHAKDFMVRHGVATAKHVRARGQQAALGALAQFGGQVVVKFDGLAAGKGVIVCESAAQAEDAVRELCGKHGLDALLVLEERLLGREVSVLALLDGKKAVLLPPAQDHKRLGDGDTGPNTGGMGAICPVPWCNAERMQRIHTDIVHPTLAGLAKDGIDYRGVLYFGVMYTADGPKLLEYNARFGDPETQAVLPQVAGNFGALLLAAATGKLGQRKVRARKGFTAALVLAAAGYPDTPRKGDPIVGIDAVQTPIFFAGCRQADGQWRSDGGRLLAVTGRGPSLNAARKNAYREASKLLLAGGQMRSDIGAARPLQRIVVLFSGRGSNLAALIGHTQAGGMLHGLGRISGAVTNKPDAGGIHVARDAQVPVKVVPSRGVAPSEFGRQLIRQLHKLRPDWIALAGYMRILDAAFVRAFAGRIVNIHPADTRQHQGLRGYEWALTQGLPQTLVTVHRVDEGLDTGPIVAQAPVDLRGALTLEEVERRGLAVEHRLYGAALADLILQQG